MGNEGIFCSELNPKSIIIYHKVLLHIPAAAIKCFVGEGDIPIVNYQPQECGGINNACVKTELTEKTTRACGVGLTDVCLGNTCTCTSTLCNGGNSFMGSNTRSLAILSFNVAIAAIFRRII